MAEQGKGRWPLPYLVLAGMLVLVISFGVGVGIGRLWKGTRHAAPSPGGTISAPAYTSWDAEQYPNYYRVAGSAMVDHHPVAGAVIYGKLDGLGRATGSAALVTYDSMQVGLERRRGDLSDVTPSGWGHNAEVDIALPNGKIYHGYLFNRSHLVAKSLGGDDEAHNLITGTRMQNVGTNSAGMLGGMAYAEDLARSWLDEHPDGQVYYAATPVYEGSELVARSVMVDVRSNDGSLDQRIEVYNTALGIDIDYADGTFEQTGDAQELAEAWQDTRSAAPAAGIVADGGTEAAEAAERMVIVTGSGKAYHHDETCSGLAEAKSLRWVTVAEAEQMGRHPCGICGG